MLQFNRENKNSENIRNHKLKGIEMCYTSLKKTILPFFSKPSELHESLINKIMIGKNEEQCSWEILRTKLTNK
jgi:hypothetical protein